jgi:hypothetical protein
VIVSVVFSRSAKGEHFLHVNKKFKEELCLRGRSIGVRLYTAEEESEALGALEGCSKCIVAGSVEGLRQALSLRVDETVLS